MPLARLLTMGIFGLLASGSLPAVGAEEPPKGKFEIRRAEQKPGKGLIETVLQDGTKRTIYVREKADLTTEDIAGCKISEDSLKRPCLEITFTKSGTTKMTKLSDDHLDKPLAFMVEGKVISAPIVRGKIGDKAEITGTFTQEELEKLVKAINAK